MSSTRKIERPTAMDTPIHHSIEKRKGFRVRVISTVHMRGCRSYELRNSQEIMHTSDDFGIGLEYPKQGEIAWILIEIFF